jgi:hypothetical protein
LTPEPTPLPTIPNSTDAEFLSGRYLSLIDVAPAYAMGATGAGIIVADVDTGADPARPDLVGAISADSTDIVTLNNGKARGIPTGPNPHADEVSSVLGARYNGFGTLGVAFGATILSIRADGTGVTPTSGSGVFLDQNTAAGIEYAVDHGASVINLSLGGTDPAPKVLTDALSYAVAKGVVIVAAAGNDNKSSNPPEAQNPEYPAALATDPRYVGFLVAAGATNSDGTLASFSNLPGTAAAGYIVAPGVTLVVDCDATGACIQPPLASGTSFAAPQVAGAIALLLQSFPNLTGPQAVQIILQSADDVGPSSVYGRGALDIGKAFAPMGTMSIPTESGASIAVNDANLAGGGLQTSTTAQAFGDALARTAGLQTIAYDSFHRLYRIDLAQGFAAEPARGLIAADPALRQTDAQMTTPQGARVDFATGGVLAVAPSLPADRLFPDAGDPGFTQVEAGIGRVSFAAWHGQGGVQPDFGEPRDAFQSVAQADQVEAARVAFGPLSLTAEGGTSARLPPMASTPVNGATYGRFGLDYSGPGYSLRIAGGDLDEPLGPLGSQMTGVFAEPSNTRFLTLGGARAVGGGGLLYGEASFGRTEFDGVLLQGAAGMSSTWRVGAEGGCAWVCSHLGVELAQPLRFESGSFSATLPDQPATYFAPLTFSLRQVSLDPSGRELDLRLFTDRDFGRFGLLRLEATAASDEGNVAGAPLGLGLVGSWRVSF